MGTFDTLLLLKPTADQNEPSALQSGRKAASCSCGRNKIFSGSTAGGRDCQDRADLQVLHMGLWDPSTRQLLGSPAGLTPVAGVTQQCWLGSPDGRSHCTIQHYFQQPQQHLCTSPACSSGCPAHPRSPVQPHTPPCRNSINTYDVQHQLQCSGILNPGSASQSSKAPSNYISAMIKPSDIKVYIHQAEVPRSGSQAQVRPKPAYKEFSHTKSPPEKILKPVIYPVAVGFQYPCE